MPAPVIQAAERRTDGTLRLAAGTAEGLGFPVSAQIPAVNGRDATARESLRTACAPEDWPAVEMACLNLSAHAAAVPLYQFLGGPTRHKVRVLTPIQGSTDEQLESALRSAQAKGAAAFAVPLPPEAPARSLTSAVVRRLELLRKASGETADFVLLGNNRSSAGEAARIARALEGFHLLWFDEPCPAGNLDALKKIADETVTSIGLGNSIRNAAAFQEFLREQVVDIVRPSLRLFGLTEIRRIAALAEAYYVAVAPLCESHPVSITAALHLAASLPNFFVQEIALDRSPNLTQGYVELPA